MSFTFFGVCLDGTVCTPLGCVIAGVSLLGMAGVLCLVFVLTRVDRWRVVFAACKVRESSHSFSRE